MDGSMKALIFVIFLLQGCAYTRHCYNITESIREFGGPESYDEKECIATAEFEKNIYWQYIRELRWL